MIGEILGNRYHIQQQLAKKAGRRTLLAKDVVTGELVIIKLLAFSSDFEWDDLKLFEREAETLKSLSHPMIPRYLDYFEINSPTIKGFALVQSYIPAQTLEQYLESGRSFSESEIEQIARAILEILIYLHGLHPPVIHRDIKPSNILLGERSGNSVGQVYLVDFGSVQTAFGAEAGTRTVVGTYGYMPPEQFGGRTVAASDLYSLGATLIYLVTGTHPADLPQKDFRIQFESVAHLSPSFTSWLKWMTEPSLERRLSSAPAALQALDNPAPSVSKLAISKPAKSKIQLTRDIDSLEIVIPPIGFQPSMVFLGLFAIACNSFILFWTIAVLFFAPFPANIPFALFSLPFWGAGSFMIYGVIHPLFGSRQIRINRETISFEQQLFQFKIPRYQPAPRENISKLIYLPKRVAAYGAQLQICAGTQEYQLNVNTEIRSQAELEWLAEELSDYLGIPLERG